MYNNIELNGKVSDIDDKRLDSGIFLSLEFNFLLTLYWCHDWWYSEGI